MNITEIRDSNTSSDIIGIAHLLEVFIVFKTNLKTTPFEKRQQTIWI